MIEEKEDTEYEIRGSILKTIRNIKVQSNNNRWDLLQYLILEYVKPNEDIIKYIEEQKNKYQNTDDTISLHFWNHVRQASEKKIRIFLKHGKKILLKS